MPQGFGRFSRVFAIDRPLAGGFSGSPIYLRESGVVYGIAVQLRPDFSSGSPAMAMGESLEKAKVMLDGKGVHYTSVAPMVNP
jgi:hypothetical protein